MKINKKATSIAEAMVMMMIVVTWVTWMYKVYDSSIKLERATNNKVIAINMAREWIEAMKNIRNTNWILFSSDFNNCWNTLNYQNACVWNNAIWTDIENDTSYIIYKNSQDRWLLTWSLNSWLWYTGSGYRSDFKVWLDWDWFYTQTWIINDIIPLFTREINIKYIEDTNWINWINSNDEKMEVTSLVQWKDNTSTSIHKVELTQILSNWKK